MNPSVPPHAAPHNLGMQKARNFSSAPLEKNGCSNGSVPISIAAITTVPATAATPVTATTTSSAAAITAATALTARAILFWPRLVDRQLAPGEFGTVELGNGFLSLVWRAHFHKAEPARLTRRAIVENVY